MYVEGVIPLKIESNKDFDYAGNFLVEVLGEYERIGNREVLVVNKKSEVTGCIDASQIIRILADRKTNLLRSPYLRSIRTAYRESLTLKNISSVIGSHRSLYILKEGVKRRRFRKFKFTDIESEITARLALNGLFDQPTNQPTNYPELLRYEVKE